MQARPIKPKPRHNHMNISEIFEAEGDGSQDDGTLFSLSDEFLEAAKILQETPPVRVGYWSATYYLLGHSAELMLKAFLFKHGLSIKDLKKINHDLEKLATLARENRLPEKVGLIHVLHLAATYKDKGFEYRTRKKLTFPPIDLLTQEIKVLQSAVFDRLWECET
jgi:hypothetical protein